MNGSAILLSSVRNDGLNRDVGNTAPLDSNTVGLLVRAAQGGDMKAFERLYRVHSGRVMGLCLRMIRERDAAEDCVQQTFIKAWRNLERFEGRSAFSTWLHGIAVNVVLSHKRSNKSWLRFEDTTATDGDGEATDVLADHQVKQFDFGDVMDLEDALKTLPDGARYVVVLQAVYGYSHEEVAEMLGIAVGTCKAQLHRARRILRHRMNFAEDVDG
jgi:RNA polymerase sigma-70 factor, ECF subfamily